MEKLSTRKESNTGWAWYNYISLFIIIGVIIGLIVAHHFFSNHITAITLGITILFTVGGILITRILNQKFKIIEAYNPVNRSEDFDDFQMRIENPVTDAFFLSQVANFSNRELVVCLTLRYYNINFSEEMVAEVVKEIKKRQIKNQMDRLYEADGFFSLKKANSCPCCGSKDFLSVQNSTIQFCHVCGYDHKIDNPNKFINRIRIKLGLVSTIKLKKERLINLLDTV